MTTVEDKLQRMLGGQLFQMAVLQTQIEQLEAERNALKAKYEPAKENTDGSS